MTEEEIIQKPGVKMRLGVSEFKRLPGHLYYCSTTEDGFLTMEQTPMSHKGRPRLKK